MKSANCQVSGCTKPSYVRDMCTTHYSRQWKTGTTSATAKAWGSLADRFERHVRKEQAPGCWIWLGSSGTDGYGQIKRGGRGSALAPAHRVSYEIYVGPIPAGLDIDHLCRNPKCVNPSHLEPVTRALNIARGIRHHPVPRPFLTNPR